MPKAGRGGRADRSMTEGGIARHLILYSIPILLSNLFQTFYTMVDALVIGWTGNAAAFAAIGTVSPVTDVLIGLVWGFVTGSEILLAQTFGKGERDEVRRVATAGIVGTLGLGILSSALGILLHGPLMHILLGADGDPEIFAHARTYLVIYFAGMPGMALYNIGCSLLRSIGDSRRPLYFLVASSVLNILLDLLFVFVIPLGVAGVALATVLSQIAAAIPLFVILFRGDTPLRLSLRRMFPEGRLLRRIFLLGLPGAIQASISSFANVFTQSYIAGADGIQAANLGGYSAYSKTYTFMVQPLSALSAGVTIFAAQNVGAGKLDRARRGVRIAILLCLGITLPLILLVMGFSEKIPYIFIDDPAVVTIATRLLLVMTPCALFSAVEGPLRSAMRGAGNTFTPMVVSMITAVGLRQVLLFLTKHFISNDLVILSLSHPATWCITMLVLYPLYLATFRRLRERVESEPTKTDLA